MKHNRDDAREASMRPAPGTFMTGESAGPAVVGAGVMRVDPKEAGD
jgi:hypothetical protein